MNQAFVLFHIVISVLLIAAILLQARGSTGLGSAFGGEGFYHSKRGLEKTIFVATVILAILFLASSVINFTNF